jgi:hypothetical protein
MLSFLADKRDQTNRLTKPLPSPGGHMFVSRFRIVVISADWELMMEFARALASAFEVPRIFRTASPSRLGDVRKGKVIGSR